MKRTLSILLALTFLVPTAALADTPDGTEPTSLLNDQTADEAVQDEEALHPSRYPHTHRRRRRARRRKPVRRVQRVKPAPLDERVGVYLGIGAMGNVFVDGDSDLSKVYNGGGGLGITLGGRFSRFFALEMAYNILFQSTEVVTTTGPQINDAALQAISIDGKIFIAPGSTRIEPYLQVGIGAYLLSETFTEELTGIGFDLGGGVDIRLNQHVALGLKALWRGFYVDNADSVYRAIPTQSAFLNTISGEAQIRYQF
jgi:opacity protein-like surface antigen